VRPAATVALLALTLLLGASIASAKVPRGWIGMFVDSPLLEQSGIVRAEHAEMAGAGVGSVRAVFDWRTAQFYRRIGNVPAEDRSRFRTPRGVPTDWTVIDSQVSAAARNRLRMLPVVMIAPDWARLPGGQTPIPKASKPFARFVATLSGRYGPRGRFWDEHPELPRVPLRDWQVWNEPNFDYYWYEQPFERRYVALLRATRRKLRRVDSGARVVAAGFANRSWDTLESLYRHGARRHFDAAAVHPFTETVDGAVEIVRRNREVMNSRGDGGTPLLVTELTWTSAGGDHQSGVATTEADQAEKVSEAYRALAAQRRRLGVGGVFWLSWLTTDRDGDIFHWSGLSRVTSENTVERKPAFFSFREVARSLTAR
jgi:hypothetical protein